MYRQIFFVWLAYWAVIPIVRLYYVLLQVWLTWSPSTSISTIVC